MKQIIPLITTAAFLLFGCDATQMPTTEETSSLQVHDFGCMFPATAVLDAMSCIEDEDIGCAISVYNPGFVKLHNGIDTNMGVPDAAFWAGAFALIDIDMEYDHISWVGPNRISLRYIETVTFIPILPSDVYPPVFQQHEHALVTVDDECRILKWDQYGDNQEQQAVADKTDEILDFLNSPPGNW